MVRILEAEDGVPITAVCDECQRVWRLHGFAPATLKLSEWARHHLCEQRLFEDEG